MKCRPRLGQFSGAAGESVGTKGEAPMKTIMTWLLFAVIAVAPVSLVSAQQKGVGPWRPVKDDVKFFSPAAKEQADQKIAEIKRKFNKDFLVEATKAPPRPKDLDPK